MFTYPVGLLNPNAVAQEFPAYSDKGTFANASSSTSIDVPFPGTVNANNTLFVVLIAFAFRGFNAVSGWDIVSQDAFSNRSSAVYKRRASGSESGTQAFTITSSANITAIMFRATGAVTTGTEIEDNQPTAYVSSSTAAIPELDTSAAKRLCISIYAITNGLDPGDPTDYTEQDVENQGAFNTTFVWNDQQIETAQTVDADSSSLGGTEVHFVYAFALIPA